MAVEKLTNTGVRGYAPQKKRYSVRDSEIQGLVLRVEPSGKKTFYLDYREKTTDKRNSFKIGDAAVLTVSQAREIAKIKLADLIRGIPLSQAKSPAEITVAEIFDMYKKQVLIHHKSRSAENFIKKDFEKFFPRVCSTLTGEDLAVWRSEEKRKGTEKEKKNSSLNRSANAFLAMLRWARENDKISICPLIQKKVKKLAESDSIEVIRYLSSDERGRLLDTLDRREKKLGQPDYLKTLVLVALNTGIRRGALMRLRWDDLFFDTKTIRLRRETAKGDRQDFIPMNGVVYRVLQEWRLFRQKTGLGEYLFIGPTGTPMHDVRSSWERVLRDAEIKSFRWHDLRHDFASQLVMLGVSILTVKELMTHSRLDQTLRYAHLAPEQKQEAVDKLGGLY